MAVRFSILVAAFFWGSSPLVAHATADDGGRLAAALRQHYKPATSKLGSDGRLTFAPGTRLTVRKEGIMSFETTDTSIATLCPSRVEGGAVHSQSDIACTKLAPVNKHELRVAETVCVTALDVNPEADKLSMVLVSCDPYNPVPKIKANRAVVLFVFPKGTLERASAAKVEGIIGQTLSEGRSESAGKPASAGVPETKGAAEGEAAADGKPNEGDAPSPSGNGSNADGGETGKQSGDGGPVSPGDSSSGAGNSAPDGDDAEAAQITKGQTMQQVTAVLGLPLSIIDVHAKTIFLYPKLKVFFVDGRVTEIHHIGS